ncbi:MAG: glycine--tRNA ligase [Candidatus Jacksonbacteria bacterium RIFCSPLOWO2_02_FULL_44_20]|uniref:Glycine--tRNA ligase n=1 Tax=Candidatus Jacksonbacteria bacterium RIFCSPLOWO2_02_FULL_44_20 TaxID=1798460 RepID=A0A1G2A5S3_9BACT|nr:MAG: glycine--tRNA ligase [Candidatus Jacksonbacteria bacterium RIFCSPLOWO2_02_FULL_44_20]OGY73995.1 MAG: glycine--tRNA ligase [Candidatus Jacksonbacteria bacterium RIFCSPLOWO2_12_FULL_44_15b]HCE86637.1 glycine--tRNA ligase [Candidatus Jacksonbacteria bacterium]
MSSKDFFQKIVSLCKRRGFVYPGSEIYGGLANTWDFGPLGVQLKKNIKDLWWRRFVESRHDIVGIDSGILMNPRVWEASGHVAGFTDPLVECKKCRKRFRADHLMENTGQKEKCQEEGCGGALTEPRNFNLMFQTHIGPTEEKGNEAYLRPETAQGSFTNFKNILDSTRVKIPFGIAQIGKAFRNEITPGNFIFRVLEFEQMEIEYFIRHGEWERTFETWQKEMSEWLEYIGIKKENYAIREHDASELSHYSKRTIDFEYNFLFGTKELYGLAYRTNFDLTNHAKYSGVELLYTDPQTGEKFIPHCIEPTFGVERTVLAILCDAYTEEEDRIVLKLDSKVAPIKVAVFPLLRNKPELVKKAREIFDALRVRFACDFDDNGNVGKRYRRQDEIGTPYCVTVDFQTLDDDTVTVRDRDTMAQERVLIKDLKDFFNEKLTPKLVCHSISVEE